MSQVAPIMHREPVELDTRYISKSLRAKVFERDQGRCKTCGAKIIGPWQCDHVTRWADGGRTELDNLQVLCLHCHQVKTNTIDTPGAAKTKRMPLACLPRDPDDIEPSRLRGRGFDRRLTKGFCGKVKLRKLRAPKASQHLGEPREGGSMPPSHKNKPGATP